MRDLSTGLVVAMIKRREQGARDKARSLANDPSLRASEWAQRSIVNAMESLRNDIEHYSTAGDRDS